MRTSDRNRWMPEKDLDACSEEHDRACKAFLDKRYALMFYLQQTKPDAAALLETWLGRPFDWRVREEVFEECQSELPISVSVDLERPLRAGSLSLPVCWVDVWIEPVGLVVDEARPLVVEVKTSVRVGKFGETLRQLKQYRELTKARVILLVPGAIGVSGSDVAAFEKLGFPVVDDRGVKHSGAALDVAQGGYGDF